LTALNGLSKGFGAAAGSLFFIWLIRSYIGLYQYGLELAAAFLLFLLLRRLTSIDVHSGPVRAVYEFFWEIASFFLLAWLFLIIFGTIFGYFFSLSPELTQYTTQALLAAIVTGIVAIILRQTQGAERAQLAEIATLANPSNLISDPNIKVDLTQESLLLRIRSRQKTYGYIGHGELTVTLRTRIGEIKRTIKGPFTLIGARESTIRKADNKRSASDADAQTLGYSSLKAFLNKCASIYGEIGSPLESNRVNIWPFVRVETTPEGERVRVPFVDVERTSRGERVKIAGITVSDEEEARLGAGPVTVESDRKAPFQRFGRYTILGFNGDKVRIEARGSSVEMHAEDYLLSVDQGSTSLRRGAHTISLSRNQASFTSPSIRAEVSQDGWANYRAPQFYIHVSGDRIQVEPDGGEKTYNNREKALKIYEKIADIVTKTSIAITQDQHLDASQTDAFTKELHEIVAKL
jgi:hypothetical protein